MTHHEPQASEFEAPPVDTETENLSEEAQTRPREPNWRRLINAVKKLWRRERNPQDLHQGTLTPRGGNEALENPLVGRPMFVIRQLQQPDGGIVLELYEPPQKRKHWGEKVAGFFKAALPITISVATLTIGYFTWQMNSRQATLTKADLTTKALEDFHQEDDGKRMLAAIKLAQYGREALPVVRHALGVSHSKIRDGAVLTAAQMYQSPQGISRGELLGHMHGYFADQNPTLNLGVLEFYNKMALDRLLTNKESNDFIDLLRQRLGEDGSRCGGVDEGIVVKAIQYVGEVCSQQAKEPSSPQQLSAYKTLLLGLTKKCPWEKAQEGVRSKYEGVRIQVPTSLIAIARHLPKEDRGPLVVELRKLASNENASPQVIENIQAAIAMIEKM